MNTITGDKIYNWACDLFPLNRSLTGEGVRETLRYIRNLISDLEIHEIASGTRVFDWLVPEEWNIEEAYIQAESGERVVDFAVSNLHVVAYSEPIDRWMDLQELDKHLYSIPDQPTAIPYVTSFYKREWGFCLSHERRQNLPPGKYHAVIKGALKKGVLNYGEIILKGESADEILLSTYLCHPSLGNNEISGIVVTMALAIWLKSLPSRRYTYRILFIPETIGAIAYLSRHSKEMKEKTRAGFILTCVGDDRKYSFMPSRLGNTLADKIARFALKYSRLQFDEYSFLERGSDERQYCSPLIDLPVVSVMRSKYGTYPEYHTSLDDLNLISAEGLFGAFQINAKCLELLEMNRKYIVTVPGEPQLGRRGLYFLGSNDTADVISNLVAYLDGQHDLLDISVMIKADIYECHRKALLLLEHGLIKEINN